VTVPDDLVATIATGLERRALDRLGLENKAGNLIWGSDRIGEALHAGRVRLLLHANDAAPDGRAKLDGKAKGAPNAVVSLVIPADRARLSLALGRENVVHAAVCDTAAAARVTAAVTRWRAFNGLTSTDGEADAASDDIRYQGLE
jgi:ribosomal protein L7Ae-like RNA K-turn-binding protein